MTKKAETIHPPADWMGDAACKGSDTELWFPVQRGAHPQLRELTNICAGCPVRRECLAAAMRAEEASHHHRHGIYGGLTGMQRQALAEGLPVDTEPSPCEVCGRPTMLARIHARPTCSPECEVERRKARRRGLCINPAKTADSHRVISVP